MNNKEHPEIVKIQELVKKAVLDIGEHCDNVRIFVCYPSPDAIGSTSSYTHGQGDYYAQYGLVKHWVLKKESEITAEAIIESKESGS